MGLSITDCISQLCDVGSYLTIETLIMSSVKQDDDNSTSLIE